jgi:hypothetical protein
MTMEKYIQAISTVGFPIAITMYLLFRMEKVITANTEAILSLKELILMVK